MCASEYDVCSPFSRRSEQYKAHDVRIHGYFTVGSMGFFGKFAIIFRISVCIGVLDDTSEYIGSELEVFVLAYFQLHSLRDDTCLDNGKIMGEDAFIYEEHISA